MSSEWRVYKLADLATFKYGKFLAKSNLDEKGYPVFSGYGVVGFLPNYQFAEPQLVIVCRGEGGTGDVKLSPACCSITNLSIVISPDEQVVSRQYLYWALKGSDTHKLRTGSAQAQIVIGSLENFPVSIPEDRSTQNGISEFLDSLDNRITLLRETNATLEAIAQALFKSWFIDFDPVRAKMEGRTPEGMDEATVALFPDSFEMTELGAVPTGWNVSSFRDTIHIIGGGTPKTTNPEYWGGDIPWFSVVDAPAPSDVFVIDTEKHITEAGLRGSSTKLLPAGTTIISARGTVGRLALTGDQMAMNQSCYGLRGNAGDSYFTYFSTARLVVQLKQKAHGSVFDTITQETFAGVLMCYPPTHAISAFDAAIEPLMTRIREDLHQIRSLANLRDTLLPRLISGQFRLREAEAALEEA